MKGQYFSFDAIIAAVIFIAALLLLSNYWGGVRSVAQSQSRSLGAEALSMSDTLLSNGTPSDWYNSVNGARAIGLAGGNANLSRLKIIKFVTLSANTANYTRMRELFGLSGDYNVTIKVFLPNGSVTETFMAGKPVPSGAVEIGQASRGSTLEGKLAAVTVRVWSTRMPG